MFLSLSQYYMCHIHTTPGFENYKKGVLDSQPQVYQLLVHGWWFSLGTPASTTTKTGRHDIAEILLKVVLNTKNQSIKPYTHANTKGG